MAENQKGTFIVKINHTDNASWHAFQHLLGNILEKESFCKSYPKRGLYASKEGVKENSLNALVQKLTNSIP